MLIDPQDTHPHRSQEERCIRPLRDSDPIGGPIPQIELDDADEKIRELNGVVLREEQVADLRDWISHGLVRLREVARSKGGPIPAKLPRDMPLFNVPDKLSKILNRDLKMAEIDKKDDRSLKIDVHTLRQTFGTLLSAGRGAPRVAQEAMRHKRIEMTRKVDTDLRPLNVQGALDALPDLSLDPTPRRESADSRSSRA